jgi:UDP-glucose 4-epimerase
LKLAQKNEDILIYGNGLQTRTFCYIDDNIDTIIKIHKEGLLENDVINIGNDKEITVLDLAKMIISITNSKSNIVHLPALKEGTLAAEIWIVSPVCGLRPLRAARSRTEKVPKPTKAT